MSIGRRNTQKSASTSPVHMNATGRKRTRKSAKERLRVKIANYQFETARFGEFLTLGFGLTQKRKKNEPPKKKCPFYSVMFLRFSVEPAAKLAICTSRFENAVVLLRLRFFGMLSLPCASLDDRQITHLICVRLQHLLYDFLGVLWASFLLFSYIKGPKHPLKKSYSKCFRRTQIR